jgi:hypothetical protein
MRARHFLASSTEMAEAGPFGAQITITAASATSAFALLVMAQFSGLYCTAAGFSN